MIIEEVSLADVKEIAQMENKYIFHPYSEDVLSEMLKNPNCLALKISENNETAGYISGQFVIDEFNVNNVVIKEQYRRRGFASALMEEVIKVCEEQKIKKIYLEVAQNNEAAKNLYKKFGFEFSYERKKYYGDQSALVLIKFIKLGDN